MFEIYFLHNTCIYISSITDKKADIILDFVLLLNKQPTLPMGNFKIKITNQYMATSMVSRVTLNVLNSANKHHNFMMPL